MKDRLTSRELATVLAALRFWQSDTNMQQRYSDTVANDGCSPLNDSEIDALCEKLNTTI